MIGQSADATTAADLVCFNEVPLRSIFERSARKWAAIDPIHFRDGNGHRAQTAASVKVCGCRPHDGGAARTGAGVRKPPMEETAGGVAR
jgi:hypothetical protein